MGNVQECSGTGEQPGRAGAVPHSHQEDSQINCWACGSRSRAGSQRFPRAPHSLGIIHLLLGIQCFLLIAEGHRSLQGQIAALWLCLSRVCAQEFCCALCLVELIGVLFVC